MVITDGESGCVDLISSNIERNAEIITASECRALHHLWGRESAQDLLRSEAICGNKFDVVMASDVIYSIDVLQPLMESAAELVAAHGVFILSNVPRCEHADMTFE